MGHRRGARGKNRHVGPALSLQLQLRVLEALADLVVADRDNALGAGARRILQCRDLRVPINLERLWRSSVVPVAVDDHFSVAFSIWSRSAIVGRQLAALDSGTRPSRIALVNSMSWRSNAGMPSSGTSLPSLSVMESRYTL